MLKDLGTKAGRKIVISLIGMLPTPKLMGGKCTATLASVRGFLVISVGYRMTSRAEREAACDKRR